MEQSVCPQTPVISLRSVGKIYREGEAEHRVLWDLDLEVGSGERVALIGPSGSGKSTLLNLIGGIDAAADGSIQVLGSDLRRLGEPELTRFRRRHIGFVYQFFNLIPTLTVAENVSLPLELNRFGASDARRRVGQMLHSVGLGDRAKSYPDRLSGGEQQRVAIARALIHAPPVLLADEPTGSLDTDTGTAVMALLDDLLQRQGASLVLVTHSVQIAHTCHRVLRLDHGRLVEQTRLAAP